LFFKSLPKRLSILFDWNFCEGQPPESFVWDTLVFKKVRARLGGRVRLITSGAAPLAPEVHDFLRVCFCCPVVQGYGLTETSAASSAQRQDDLSSGNVGAVFPSVGLFSLRASLTFCSLSLSFAISF
jgi:long-subunit acyl-CoA synthetase (AMP-forming)